jgi:tetratricopeptide (TPR) repeat protein
MELRRGVPILAILAMLAGLLLAQPAAADQKDPRLDKLFQQLKTATSTEESYPIEIQIWQIWTEANDTNIDALMDIGIASMNDPGQSAAEYKKALQAFDKVVSLAPGFAEGWNKRATLLYLLGRYEDSIKDIEKTLALEPRHFGALSGLGLCEAQLHREKEAFDAFEKALAINPNMPGVRLNAEEMKKALANKSI